jgi:hypothetical protein
MAKERKPLTYKVGDSPANREALEKAKSLINAGNPRFFRAINGVLVTEDEYIAWRENGGARGDK